jgi:hypothetical protein
VPEWLWELVTNVLSSEADVLEQVLAELAQLPPRTGAGAPQSDGRDYPPDYSEARSRHNPFGPKFFAAPRADDLIWFARDHLIDVIGALSPAAPMLRGRGLLRSRPHRLA